jgi:hypothetical protein
MHLVHPDRQNERVAWPDSFAALANRAYGVLRNQDVARQVRSRGGGARRDGASRQPDRGGARGIENACSAPPSTAAGPLDGVVLPEWLTAGVGGFVREHPSVTAFTALIAVVLLTVALMVWERPDGALTREVASAAEEVA